MLDTHPRRDNDPIPFNQPSLTARELELVTEALEGGHLAGDGPFTTRATLALSQLLGGTPALLTTSCTHALELSAHLLGLEPGDEVIMPSFTFVSCATAFVARRAVPVFIDIRPDTLNIDESEIEAAITDRTRAILVVHYAGVAAEMSSILAVARKHGLVVIEDNAHGLGASYKGRPLGTIGQLATQSFHATKNIVAGEGGALIFGDPTFKKRAEILREKGTNRSAFLRGAVDKYTWVDEGSSYLPSDILAALLLAQLERFEKIQAARHRVWNQYQSALGPWAEAEGVRLPHVPDHCSHSAHIFYLLMPDARHQAIIIDRLAEEGITATFHYQPLHSSPAGGRLGRTSGTCDTSTWAADRIVRLPLYPALQPRQVDRIVDSVISTPL